MAEPRYETAAEQLKRTGSTDSVVCMDCGVFVMNVAAHTRFHSIESSWAWALAVLKTAHVAAHFHDKYDVVERIDSRKFDNWSADALAEVIASQAFPGRTGTAVPVGGVSSGKGAPGALGDGVPAGDDDGVPAR